MTVRDQSTLPELEQLVGAFTRHRGWTNDSKNLAMSVAIEAAELMEIYQWKATSEALTESERAALALECADVLWYLLRLCESESIDLAAALKQKHTINETRFPPKQAD